MNKIIEISIKIIQTACLFIFLVWNFMILIIANYGLASVLNQPNLTQFQEKIFYYMWYLLPIYALLLLTAVLYYTIKIWDIDKIIYSAYAKQRDNRIKRANERKYTKTLTMEERIDYYKNKEGF